MDWNEVPRDEQETIINIDYYERTLSIYTNRKAVAVRLQKKFGEPTNTFTSDSKLYAVEYKRSLDDKNLSTFFSKTILVGNFNKKQKDTN